jgi:AAT family amino acid transporter
MDQDLENGGKFNYLYGLINLAVVFCIVWLLWYFFMHADGVMKLYTPMYGFSLVAMLLVSVIVLSKVLGWPGDGEKALNAGSAIGKGILGTVIALAIMYFVYYVVFWRFIGGLGVAYFSPDALVAGGGTGAEPWNAREWSSTAILYFSTAFLWWALVWDLGFGRWPWQKDGPWVVGFSKLFVISFFAIITFAVMFHPHVCVLFPEAQKMVGAQAWWEVWAETGSAFWGLGLVLCTLFWVVFCDLFWEGRPFSLMDKDGDGTFLKGVVTFLATLALGLLLITVLTQVFNAIWLEPYQGGQYTDGPDWRYIHMGEISGFCVLFAFIWKNYFNNFPNGLPLILRAVIRSVIGLAGGLLVYWFYYSSLSNFFLGKVEGWAQPDDQPLVWTLLFLSVVLIQSEFFHNWPLRIARGNK